MRCDICGELHSLDKGKIIEGSGHVYFVCDDCEPDNYVICDDCGELVEEDRTYTTHDNRIICEKCYESNDYSTCERCGEVVEGCRIVHIEDTDEYVCDDCAEEKYYQCMECGNWYSSNKIITDSEGQHLCEDCYCDNYYTCAECLEFVHQDNCYWDESREEAYCAYCHDTKFGNRVINSYHSNNNWTVHYTKDEYNDYMPGKLTLGLEIEVAGITLYADEFMERVDNDLIYLENDSSVAGFEIITQPMTRQYATEIFTDKISKGFKYLRENNFKGHDAGGIHIHARLPYDNLDFMSYILKLKKLLYNLSPRMQDLLLLISQREPDELKCWSNNMYHRKLTLQNCILQDSRYELLNMDSRTRTLEFRMFNSNLRTERIMKNIEVVLSLLDYVETYYTTDMYSKNLFTWLDYVKRNEEKYPNLVSFINEDKTRDKLCEIGYIKEGVESICA
nr:MAG TPA: putative amidoligase enzyme [Caudoviricetes sp.]